MMLTDRSGSFKTQLPNVEGSSQSTGHPCCSRDSQHVLVFEARGSERALKAFDIDDLTLVWHLEDEKLVGGCFDPRDQRVLCVQQDELHLNAFPSGDLIARLSLSNLSSVKIGITGPEVAFGPGGETLYFLGTDGGLYRWDIGGSAELVLQDEPDQTTVGFTREDYRFRATDGREIPVQRYLPPDPNGRAIVYVEGGPGGTIRPNNLIVLRLLEEGYEVVRPAYRGTWGYGTEHFDANRGECGCGDVRDIVDCGLDWKTRFGTAGRPLALVGFSYGGYLTFLALGYPEAPWTCGITLWGATTVPPGAWATGLPSGLEVDEALRETSAVAHAYRISFPLLILHGGRDNTPTKDVQSIQKAVHHSGRPCDLVVFEEDGHGLFASQKEMLTRMLDFLDAYCK